MVDRHAPCWPRAWSPLIRRHFQSKAIYAMVFCWIWFGIGLGWSVVLVGDVRMASPTETEARR